MNAEDGDPPAGSFGRHLPPLTSVHSHASALGEGPLSPHSAPHHYHHQNGSDAGYFPPTYPYGQRCQLPTFASPQQTNNHNYENTLLIFAKVAVGTATPSGRRSLEVEAAAEVLAGRRGSGGSSGRSDNVVRIAQAEQNRTARSINLDGNKSSQLDKSSGGVSSHHADIEYVPDPFPLLLAGSRFVCVNICSPELRPTSAGSAASTGRTIEDETSIISIGDGGSFQPQRSSMATQTNDLPYNHDTPLFRPTPEVSTPRPEPVAISADAGPSTSVILGPLAAPPSPYDFLNQSPKCSYCNICTTGSPLRKVVSHIFGRNKLSTRQIPKNVWVYYCRKHYQRSRYRNPRGFARQQVSLVKRQCERLELWGGVKDWVIKVRRREELRMNREGDNGEDIDEVDDELEEHTAGEEPEPNDGGPTSGESSRRNSTATTRRRSSTGGNNWIMRHTGIEKTINDIYILLQRIEIEVQENGGKFPDVELLPNVDLAMAVPIRGHDSGSGEGGSGNDGDQEGADGVAGSKSAKKRRRSDGSGSSGVDEGNSRSAKKAKTAAVKKGGDRKGKGKAPSHAEAVPTDKVSRQSKGAHGFQVAYQRAFSPEVPHEYELKERIRGVNVFTGAGLENQIATPPPSTPASTGRSTPELEPAFVQLGGPSNSVSGSSHCHSPRHSARVLPSASLATPGGHGNSVPAPKSTVDFSPNMLATMASHSFSGFHICRPDAPACKEVITKSNQFGIGNEARFGNHDEHRIPEYARVAQI